MTGRRGKRAPRLRPCLSALLPGIILLGFTAPSAGVDWGGVEDITIELSVRGGEEGYFVPGQEMAFYFEADRDCYLVIYNIDARGRVVLLHPEHPDYSARVEGNRRYRVPPRSSSYDLYLGEETGIEYLVAVASERRISVRPWFPDGLLASPEEIYWEEGLDDEGFSESAWIEEDAFLAMDLINERLVPPRRRDDGYGEEYLALRVGMYAERYDESRYWAERIDVVHHYDPLFWDPLWADPFGGPLYFDISWHRHWQRPWSWYGPRYGACVGYYYDPFWDPYWMDWYGPWGSGWWVSANYGVGIHWWSWPRTTQVVSYVGPSGHWGSRVKWKSYRYGVDDRVSKERGGRVGELTAAPAVGLKAPRPPATRYRLEPTTLRASGTVREISREQVGRTRTGERRPADEMRVERRPGEETRPPAAERERTRSGEARPAEKDRRAEPRAERPRTREEGPRRDDQAERKEKKARSGGQSPPSPGASARRSLRRGSSGSRGSSLGRLVRRAAQEALRTGSDRARERVSRDRPSRGGDQPAAGQSRGSSRQRPEARPSRSETEKKPKRRR